MFAHSQMMILLYNILAKSWSETVLTPITRNFSRISTFFCTSTHFNPPVTARVKISQNVDILAKARYTLKKSNTVKPSYV